jgi:predicted RNA binding protein YcfA (HicA-like mRNA interferase family)
VAKFPSLKARKLLRILCRVPLAYQVVRQAGSHRKLESSAGYPPLTFSWHDGATVPAGAVRKVLVKDIGLEEEEALKLL